MTIEANRRRMVQLLREMAKVEGTQGTSLDGVKLARADRSYPRTPVLYEPSIVILASGQKRGYVGGREFVFDASEYLVLSVPLAFEVETDMTGGEMVLGVSVRVDLGTLSELTMKMDRTRGGEACDQKGVQTAPMDEALSEAALRLLECLRSPVDAAVLGPGIVREIVYRVLAGPEGGMLWALLGLHGQLAQIHGVLQRMHVNPAKELDVPAMAAAARMSVSAFHHHFKAVIGTSPLQYLKTLRLHKARMLMLHDRLGAAEAAARVGYESASQFSREFKRFFGRSPRAEMEVVREPAAYVPLGSAMVM